jgi:DNA-binding IclR family transcriptional regulator
MSTRKKTPTPEPAAESSTEAAAGNQSVSVSVSILEELAAEGQPLGVTELAKRLNESKGRTHRHLSTLRALGLVAQDEVSERYFLGWKIFRLGMAAAENFSLSKIAMRHMTRLRDNVRQTIALAIPANGDAIVIASVGSDNPISIQVKHGWVVPSHGSALGRCILAFSPPAMQKRVLSRPLQKFSEKTLTDPEVIAKRLKAVRERFFELAVNETSFGVSTLAAPVFDERDGIVAAIGVVGSHYHITQPPEPALLEALQACAASISEELNSKRWKAR